MRLGGAVGAGAVAGLGPGEIAQKLDKDV